MNAIVCPRCGDPVRVPSVQIPDDAMFRCTWCSESFAVSELNDRLPPLLQVVSPTGEVLSLAPTGGYDELQDLGEVSEIEAMDSFNLDDAPSTGIANAAKDEASLGISGDGLMVSKDTLVEDTWKDEGAAPLDFGDEVAVEEFPPANEMGTIAEDALTVEEELTAEPTGEEWPLQTATETPTSFADDVTPMRVNPRSGRASKKSGSPIMMAAKVIGGGLASVPVAAAILATVGKPLPIDLGFWPFLGDSPAAVASTGNRAAPLPASVRQPKQRPAAQRPKAQIMQPPPEVTEQVQATEENAMELAADPAPAMEAMPDQSLESLPDASPDAPAVVDSAIENTAEPPDSTFAMPELDTAPEPQPETVPEPESEPESQPEPQTPPAAAASLPQSAIEALDQAISQFDAAASETDTKKQKRFLQKGFMEACEAAGELPSVPTADPTVAALFAKIRDSQAKTMISKGAWQWIGMKNRKTDGILLIGDTGANSIGSIVTVGDGKVIEVEGEQLLPEGRVIGLGKILDSDNPPRVRIVAVEPVE